MAPLQLPTESRSHREEFSPAASRTPRQTNHEPRPSFRPDLHREPRPVRVALAGCGVVGGGLVRLLHEHAPSIASRFDTRLEITTILVRDLTRVRNLPIDPGIFTNDLDEFLSHDVDVVVEAVGGEEPARAIASHALNHGRKFISANKDLIASHGVALARLAAVRDAGLDFGAAVGGSAPIVSVLRDVLGATAPRSVRGILNGTSNYVLSEVERGVSFDAALAAARSRGLAESDCSRDIDGRDAAAKLKIIAWIAFGIEPAALDLRRTPLPADPSRLVHFASLVGGRARLIAECVQLPGHEILASVEPTIVPADSGFGRTQLEENRVEIDLGWGTPITVSGAGAGGAPTATAILADLVGTERPRNTRGRGATNFVGAPDDRLHRWLVFASVPSDRLQALAKESGIRSERIVSQGSCSAIVSAPVARQKVRPLLWTLEVCGAEPAVARYELNLVAEEDPR